MYEYVSRYDFGVKKFLHKDKITNTSINTEFFDNVEFILGGGSYSIIGLKEYVKHRPDTISDLFYDNPSYWWYLLLYNNINDPFNFMSPGDGLAVPDFNEFLRK